MIVACNLKWFIYKSNYIPFTEIAWDIISEFATELLEGPDIERVKK